MGVIKLVIKYVRMMLPKKYGADTTLSAVKEAEDCICEVCVCCGSADNFIFSRDIANPGYFCADCGCNIRIINLSR